MLEEVYPFFTNFTLQLILRHLVSVVLVSLQHRENRICSMFTSLKQQELP